MAAPQVIDGVTAPAGGFQQGGWYEGRQYWGGTLSPKGVINSQSNQQGAGQAVSPEVNAQSAQAQGKTPQQFDAYLNGKPTSSNSTIPVSSGSGSAQSILDTFQSGATGALSNINTEATQSDAQILAQVKSQLQPKTAQPPPPNLAQTEASLQVSTGLQASQAQLTNINSQIAAVNSALEAQKANAESQGGDTPLNVVAGRETEAQRQARIKLDSLNLQKGVLVDQINMQTQNIAMIMQFTQQDYQNAAQAWQTEFDVNAKIYDAFTAGVQNRDNLAFKIQQAAATNLQTVANLLTSGNISWGSMSPDAQLQITQMEAQAGLPIGTMSNIQMSAKDRLLNVSNYRGQVTAIVAGQNGQITTQTFGSPAPLLSGGTKATQNQVNQSISSYKWQKDSSGNSISPFMQFVADYAPSYTLKEIYKLYNDSPEGQKYGTPHEDPTQIQQLYTAASGQ